MPKKKRASSICARGGSRGQLLRRGEEDYEESSGSPELVLIPPRPLWDSAYETLCYAPPE
jgi:hypothetical protein